MQRASRCGWCSKMPAITSLLPLARRTARRPRGHLVQHHAERPDVGARVDVLPSACSGAMYVGVPIRPASVCIGASVALGARRRPAPRQLGDAEVEHLDDVRRRRRDRITFSGLRSRCTIPSAWAAVSADATGSRCRGPRRAGGRPGDPSRSFAFDELHHDVLAVHRRHRPAREVHLRDVFGVPFRRRMAAASRWKRDSMSRSARGASCAAP